ncbi:MAG: heme lyase CcmF/NrfE family subunit [Alphaproteobacteria bacterium]|nr:heme lyase CcmF/NrfE family subunit [Alphaproteobacteria bacterium]
MTAELGGFLLALALVMAFAQGALGLIAGWRRNEGLGAAAAGVAQSNAIILLAAFAILVSLFLRTDYSVAVVAANSHVAKPLLYKIAGTWGNHEGSMLLWCLVSATFAALLASFPGGMGRTLWNRAVGVQGVVTGVAIAYTLVLSSPFARLDPAPLTGKDLNPLLQDPALAIHPPMLYLGYVGLSVPFSLAIAALMEGKVDSAWARALRPWTLIAWVTLTLGITLGSYWAYYELGWGGWWFWDPVENASFMPWLAAAALLHSAIVTERRGSLAAWTILLAIIGFGLALLGTFLVRSGVLTSVHAFAVDPQRGYAILAMLAFFVGGGFMLYAWRAPRLSEPSGFLLVSRESALVVNNVGLAVAMGTVLIGTLYPLLLEAMTDRLISVGPPFFNVTFGPLMALLFLALPIAPFLAWRRGDLKEAWRWLQWAAYAAAGVAVVTLALLRGPIWSALGLAVGVWVLFGALLYAWKRAGSFVRIAALPLAFWAMTAAHVGAGVFTIGAAAETAFRKEEAAQMLPGASVSFAGRRITLTDITTVEGPNYTAQRAIFRVEERIVTAERRSYTVSAMPTTEVGILGDLTGDLYIALGAPTEGTIGPAAWTVRLYFNPLVQWIFAGAGLMALGGALGLVVLARRSLKRTVPAAAATAT